MDLQILPNATGASLAAFILREARRRGQGLKALKLHGLTYYVYGWGIVHFNLSLTGFERLMCTEFGPCFETLLTKGLPFGNGEVHFEIFSPPGHFDLSIYDRILGVSDLVHRVLDLGFSAERIWNSTQNPTAPWAIARNMCGDSRLGTIDIEPSLIRATFQEIERNHTERHTNGTGNYN